MESDEGAMRMKVTDPLVDAFDRVRTSVHKTVADLDAAAITWRPDPQANSIAWLVWHLSRVADDHVSEVTGRDQVWVSGPWAERFGLTPGTTETGYGHSAQEVASVVPQEATVLRTYHDLVVDEIIRDVRDLAAGDLDRVIDRSYDPPVTVGVRLVSVIADGLKHVGQAAYVRGLWERR